MLLQISLNNYAIIENLSVDFTNGLNIITGETGTGKSIIIDAVNILLGDRVNTDIVKTGKEEAVIEALFDISDNKNLIKTLKDQGFEAGDGQLLIKRIIPQNGRGRIFINGSIATLSILLDITGDLIDIFSQHEHQSLLKPSNHIKYLDTFADNFPLFEEYRAAFVEYSHFNKKLEEYLSTLQEQTEKIEKLKFELKEISDVNPIVGEENELESEEKWLSNAERISQALSNVYGSVYESEHSAYNMFKNSVKDLSEIKGLEERLEGIYNSLNSIMIELEETSYGLRDYLSKIDNNPVRLEEINQRLAEISGIKRKYGDTIEQVLNHKEKIEYELSEISGAEESPGQLEINRDQALNKLNFLAEELSLNRKEAAGKLIDVFNKEAEYVGLKGAVLDIEIEKKPVSPDGTDSITFLFSANPGEAPKPLNKVASGGELSRIMLVLKELLSRKESGSILIFDEADSGIGGVTAETIGKKIRNLSVNNQVICITHLPQVAKFAKSHYRVSKSLNDNKTDVDIKKLSSYGRIEEIGRMLAGENLTTKTLEAAKEMLSNV